MLYQWPLSDAPGDDRCFQKLYEPQALKPDTLSSSFLNAPYLIF